MRLIPAATAARTVPTHSSSVVAPQSIPMPPPPSVSTLTGGREPKGCVFMVSVLLEHGQLAQNHSDRIARQTRSPSPFEGEVRGGGGSSAPFPPHPRLRDPPPCPPPQGGRSDDASVRGSSSTAGFTAAA